MDQEDPHAYHYSKVVIIVKKLQSLLLYPNILLVMNTI